MYCLYLQEASGISIFLLLLSNDSAASHLNVDVQGFVQGASFRAETLEDFNLLYGSGRSVSGGVLDWLAPAVGVA